MANSLADMLHVSADLGLALLLARPALHAVGTEDLLDRWSLLTKVCGLGGTCSEPPDVWASMVADLLHTERQSLLRLAFLREQRQPFPRPDLKGNIRVVKVGDAEFSDMYGGWTRWLATDPAHRRAPLSASTIAIVGEVQAG